MPCRGVDTQTGRREAWGMLYREEDTQTGTREARGVPCRGGHTDRHEGGLGNAVHGSRTCKSFR